MQLIHTKRDAHRLRRKGELVVKVKLHADLCLGRPPLEGLPPMSCTCNRKGYGYCIVLNTRHRRAYV